MLSTRRKVAVFGGGGLALATFVGIGLAGEPPPESGTSARTQSPTPSKDETEKPKKEKAKPGPKPTVKADPDSLRDEINRLDVRREYVSGYDRDLFGYDSWNVRQALELAELRSDGNYLSPWDGKVYSDVSKMDADHTVALAEAWASGARNWSGSERREFANNTSDPYVINLLSSGLNRGAKSDNDPAEWLPQKNRCVYIKQWVQVKLKYDLSVDPAEKSALLSASCKGTEKMGRGTVVVPPPPPPTEVPDKDSGGSVYYDNCDAVREAGAAPLLKGQPGYESPRLDRDGDGSACGSD